MGVVNKLIKKTPSILQRAYYNLVPFEKRYGKVYKKTLDFLVESHGWSKQLLESYQLVQMRKLLDHCYWNVPYYKRIFVENKWTPADFRNLEDLKNFPVLTKKIIMENRDGMIRENSDHKRYPISTSGSTGDKLTFFVDDDCLKKEAAFNMRAYLVQGAEMYDTPSVWLRRYVPPNPESSLWYYDYELKRLYMSAYHLNSETIHQYVEKINEGNYQTMCTYPSSAYIFACLCEEQNLSLRTIKKIHTTSEVLVKKWYDKVLEVFDIVPCGHYGQMEKVSFMHQSEQSRDMNQNLEYGIDEFYDNGDGTHGLIATGFINYFMPFIRYKTEDTFILEEGVVKEVNGRTSDILVSADGCRLPGVNFYSWVDKKMPAIKMFQILQYSQKDIIFDYVQSPDYKEDITEDIRTGLQSRLGDMRFQINKRDEIKRNKDTNKFKCIINKVA